MIKIENYEVVGWEHAIRGMRNPMNSHSKMDSFDCRSQKDNCADCRYRNMDEEVECPGCRYYAGNTNMCGEIGPNDHELMMKLRKAGTDHRKFMRMITVYVDITAPLYWWKEFDTYKVGTVANSCSTMHKIHERPFIWDDFSWDQLLNTGCNLRMLDPNEGICETITQPLHFFTDYIIPVLNTCREKYIETKNKDYWWQIIQLLPSSYNQKRTVMLNYEVLANMYKSRKNHKLDEWRELCKWIEGLPYSELITGEDKDD